MYREYVKAKTAAKVMTTDPKDIKSVVLKTLKEISNNVGITLGPNGRVVALERQEQLPPITTKDGISVFNSLAFSDPTAQVILEISRESSSKTNAEAGDGTTTATILAEAITRFGFEYLENNRKISFQKVMRELESCFKDFIVPFISKNSVKITNDNEHDLLRKVSLIATNNDNEMSDAVIEALELVGDNGQVTITESSGAGGFEVEKVEGFHIPRGFEESCGRFLEEFINDKANYRTVLEKPHFILYNGKINEPSVLVPVLQKIASATGLDDPTEKGSYSPNIVVVAHHFSEQILAWFAQNFKESQTLNMVPLLTPLSYQANGQYHFLLDLAAFTGANLFDPLTHPLENANLEELGLDSITAFEFYRYKSLILGRPDELLIMARAEELEQQKKHAESSMDYELLNERLAILTGGIARVKVLGSVEAELKEKRARVEDAVCAAKGALKYGVLPGCAKTLLTLSSKIKNSDYSESVKSILGRAFTEPFKRIFLNGGLTAEELTEIYSNMTSSEDFLSTYDALSGQFGNALDLGIIDSASAVTMAIKNSLAVSKMLMGLGSIVVFKRDLDSDIAEARDSKETNEAMKEATAKAEKDKWEVPF